MLWLAAPARNVELKLGEKGSVLLSHNILDSSATEVAHGEQKSKNSSMTHRSFKSRSGSPGPEVTQTNSKRATSN